MESEDKAALIDEDENKGRDECEEAGKLPAQAKTLHVEAVGEKVGETERNAKEGCDDGEERKCAGDGGYVGVVEDMGEGGGAGLTGCVGGDEAVFAV